MIKFVASTPHSDILFGFGLSRENINQLVKGNPIKLNLEEMGFAGVDVLIFFGETEEQMAEDMKEFVGDHTIIIDRKKGVEN